MVKRNDPGEAIPPSRLARHEHDAIGAIYAAAAAPESWPRALDALALRFDAAGAVLLFQKQDFSMAAICSPALADAQSAYEAGAWQYDLLASRLLEKGMLASGACVTEQDLVTPDEIATHPFFTDFRAKHGLGSIMGGMMLPHPSIPVIVSVHGRSGNRPFTRDEVFACEHFMCHVERSLALTVRLMDAEVASQSLMGAFSRLSCGVFILDRNRTILFHNDLSTKMLANGLAISGNRLTVSGPDSEKFERRFRDACAPAEAPTDKTPPLILKSRSDIAVVLYALPVTGASPVGRFFSSAAVIVLVLQQSESGPADPTLVRDLLDLTLAEARLATLIGFGKSPREAAEHLNISELTARTVLKRIFSKTGVSRQSQLSALIAQISSRTI